MIRILLLVNIVIVLSSKPYTLIYVVNLDISEHFNNQRSIILIVNNRNIYLIETTIYKTHLNN
jgi:predicted nucleotide-binding protein (sugar kinase/HSP70/actin superfamily)